ncbi:MAG: leucyl aminopeptidase [Desulfobacterales bacterium]
MLELKSPDLKTERIGTLVIPVCEDADIHDSRAVSSLAGRAEKLEEFKRGNDAEVVFFDPSEINASRVICMGIGKKEKLDAEVLRSFGGKAVKGCIKRNLEEIFLAAPSEKKCGKEMSDILESLMEGACLGNHIYEPYKEEKKQIPLKKISVFVKPQTAAKFAGLAERVENICAGTVMAREWVSMPANEKRPEQYADMIADAAEKAGLAVRVMDEKQLEEQKFGSLLSVARGSEAKARLVILEYKAPKAKKHIALVGKGVTFDSGGLNLKVGEHISGMKIDMAGSAAVAAAMIAAAKTKPKVRLTAVIPIVENMPSGTASRPGDVVRSYDGKTVEIGNTDAEGRLILIDAMSYAIRNCKPDALIDLATLTGACVVALGERIAGVFSPDTQLAETIVASGKKTHERCWHMPMPEDYKEFLKSKIADISNMSSSKAGGAITASLFLSAFAKDTRWAHIDIAGPSYTEKGNAYCNPGGTGFGVRLLCDLLEKI